MEVPMADDAQRVKEILAAVKPLAAEYYRLTKKPLGVTGEIAEYVAAEKLNLVLAPPRTSGYDAIRKIPGGEERIQIKGRTFGEATNAGQRLGRIKTGAACDKVLLVVLDNATLEPVGMWEAPYAEVVEKNPKVMKSLIVASIITRGAAGRYSRPKMELRSSGSNLTLGTLA
jgi:hypothetical protein